MDLHSAAKFGNQSAVKNLLRSGEDIDSLDADGRTPLSWAAEKGHTAIVEILLAKDVIDINSKDNDGQTPLLRAAEKGHTAIVKLLLAKDGIDISSEDNNGQTPLSRVAENGYTAIVELLLAKDGIDINSQNNFSGRTPLSWAAKNGHTAVVELLLAKGDIDMNIIDIDGQTPLSLAARSGYETVVELLLAKDGIDINSEDDYYGRTPLSWAARNGHTAIVELLLAKDDIDTNFIDNDGRTPLSWAAEKGNTAVVEILLAKDGIKINSKDNDYSQIPLSWATENGCTAVVELLLAKDGTNLNTKNKYGQTPLSLATKEGRSKVVELLLTKDGIDLNSKDDSGRTPLLLAVENGYTTVVELLLAKDGTDLNAKNKYGQTPLSLAAEKGRSKVVEPLLAKDGIDLNSKDNGGQTPLSWAAENGYTTVVELLLAKDGIDLNSKDDSGRTPLLLAAENGYTTVVELLLAKDGIDLNSKDNGGRTPLSRAAENWHRTVVRLVAAAFQKNYPSRTPLSWAAENGHKAVVSILLANDRIHPNFKDKDGRTPLARAAENGHTVIVELLSRSQKDTITLHMLVQEGKRTPVNLLLSANYKVNIKDILGRTPLHIATLFGYLEISRELISHGAEINSKDSNGTTPLRSAIQHKDHDLIELLLKNSAEVKGVTVAEWLDTYGKNAPNIAVQLSEGSAKDKRVCFIEEVSAKLASLPAEPGVERHLFLFTDYHAWQGCMISTLKNTLQADKSKVFYKEQTHSSYVSISVAVWFPTGVGPENRKQFDISDWGKCAVSWTMVPPTKPEHGSRWKSMNHFSMLPNGWIPDDGSDFFAQFICNLKGRWLRLCGLADEHLSKRRLDQLREKGESSELIHLLAKDAQRWAELRSVLQGQVRTANNFATEYCRRYDGDTGLEIVQEAINGFSDDVNNRISQLDQTVKDLLQFEFAWVSINEAHRSTSIATSIKRLSWITFIFLPAMFASSLFGMNVDILETHPDWRWYILFGGGFLAFTIVGWLLFKHGQIEGWVERHVGERLERWGKGVAGNSQELRKLEHSRQVLPTSEPA